MKIRSVIVAILLAVITVFSSGCAKFGVDINELIVPPESTGELYEISQALYNYVGKKEITLRYPKSGDWRSAFILNDIDGDGQQEALAFYSTVSGDNINVMHINLISKVEGKWVSVSDHSVESGGVESVAFEQFENAQSHEIIVCWSTATSPTNKLSVFRFDKGGLTQLLQENYSIYSLCDLTSGKGNELVIVANDTIAKKAYAKVFSESRQEIIELGSCDMDPEVTSYYTPVRSTLTDGTPALFIDGKKAATGNVTEVIYIDENAQPQNLFIGEDGRNSQTHRISATESYDFNGDRSLDIPLLVELPGIRGETDQNPVYLTEWYGCDKQEGLKQIGSSIMNYTDKYQINIAEEWKDKLAVERSSDMTETVFYEYNSDMALATHELFRIKTIPENQYKATKEDYADFFQIAISDGLVVLGKVSKQNGWGITELTVRNNFALLK